jgi:AsmA-like C-terminal region
MPGFWHTCRLTFRWCRLAVWVLVLTLLGAFLWLNRIGLPDFLKTRLVTALREQGAELSFTRMRLSLVHGLIAENVRAGQSGAVFGARLAQLELDYAALRHRTLELDGLKVRDGFFALPLSPTNTLTLTNLQAEIRFGTRDTWSVDQLTAKFSGVQIGICGELAHARAALAWKIFQGGTGADRSAAQATLNDVIPAFHRFHFQGIPQVRLKISGDGRDVHSVALQLESTADGLLTPWFGVKHFQALATLTAPAGAPANCDPALAFWTNLQPFQLAWSVRLGELRSEKLDANDLAGAGHWLAPNLVLSNFTARIGNGIFQAEAALDVATRDATVNSASAFDWHALGQLLPEQARLPLAKISWAAPPKLSFTGGLRLPAWTNAYFWDWQNDWLPTLSLRGELGFTHTTINGGALDSVHTHFHYFDRLWELPDLTVAQGGTQLRFSGQESAATQNIHFIVTGGFDPASLRSFLPEATGKKVFSCFTTTQPLALALDVSGNLRAWETFAATGRVALSHFTVREQALDSLAGELFYSHKTATFFAPKILRAGGTQQMTADNVVLDFGRQIVWITNGWSTAEPQAVANMVGPQTAGNLRPFQFLSPPRVRVNGSVPLHTVDTDADAENADLTFEMKSGVPFRWKNIFATNATATIHWVKQSLIVTNIEAELYDGHGQGWCNLDFRPHGYDFDSSFFAAITNVNLHLLAADLGSKTNHLEGQLNGEIKVTYANSKTWRSWNGAGRLCLRDGILWDVPIFAFVSPMLNTVSPGLGNSRATEATAEFILTNGVAYSDPVVIRAATMRLQYAGTVDLEQNVKAKVTAQLLRNMPVLGSVFSAALWPVSKIFECRVAGQLDNPVVTPVYLPKILLVPLHPLRCLEELFTPDSTHAAGK